MVDKKSETGAPNETTGPISGDIPTPSPIQNNNTQQGQSPDPAIPASETVNPPTNQTPSNLETPANPETPPSSENTQENTVAKTESIIPDTGTAGKTVKVKISGTVKGEKEFPSGTSFKNIVAAFSDTPNNFEFYDSKGKQMTMTSAIKEDLVVTASAKVKAS